MPQWLSYPTFSGPFSGQEQLLAASSASPGAGMIRIPWNSVANSTGSNLFLPFTGGTLTGPLYLFEDPLSPTEAATKNYVDNNVIAGGPFLKLSGGTLAGPVTFAESLQTLAGTDVQALHDALPAEGGTIFLAPNAVYVVDTQIAISKPNVRIAGPSWNTILRRTVGMTGAVISITGDNCTIENLTVDGNATVYDGVSHSELRMFSTNGLVDHCQVINGGGAIHLTLAGEGACARNCTVVGLGIVPPTETGYGIWAINGNTIKIVNNTISGTGIDGIGFDGAGSIVSGNRVSSCHWFASGGGGQIASYPGSTSCVIANNSVGPGGGIWADGIEVAGDGGIISGNVIDGVQGYGVHLDAVCDNTSVIGNIIHNIGSGHPTLIDGIYIAAGVSNFSICDNRVTDDRVTPIMRTGLWLTAGASDQYTIVNNIFYPTQLIAMVDAGTGANKIIANNVGIDDVVGAITTASTITIPIYPVSILFGAGAVTDITTAGVAKGRRVTLMPNAIVTFTAGASIINSITASQSTGPVNAVFDGTQWHLASVTDLTRPPIIGGTTPNQGFFSSLAAGGGTTLSSSVFASSPTDNSKFLMLYGPNYGMNVSSGRMNIIAPLAGPIHLVHNTFDVLKVDATSSAPVVTVGNGVYGSPALVVDGAVATPRVVEFNTAGLARWSVLANGAAEAGANAGSNFSISRYDDTGASIDSPFVISRATGRISLSALQASTTYANDGAAAAGGIAVGECYRNGSVVQIRIT